MDEKQIMAKLAEPFPPEEIEWRVGSTNGDKTKGIALAYVTNRAIQNRLDEVFGCFGWKNEFREWKGNAQICGISILHEGQWVTKWDGADDSNMEAVKGGLSDAMKRAAYQWGIGRYLYNLENVWVPIEPRGKSYVLKEIPKLPAWALPKGYEYPKQTQSPPKQAPPMQAKQQPPKQTQPASGKCSNPDCGVAINQAVEAYSVKHYGKPLCQKCQAKAKEGKAS
jgi:hypothetical protein